MATHFSIGTGREPLHHWWTVGGCTPRLLANALTDPTCFAASTTGWNCLFIPPTIRHCLPQIKALPYISDEWDTRQCLLDKI